MVMNPVPNTVLQVTENAPEVLSTTSHLVPEIGGKNTCTLPVNTPVNVMMFLAYCAGVSVMFALVSETEVIPELLTGNHLPVVSVSGLSVLLSCSETHSPELSARDKIAPFGYPPIDAENAEL